MSHPADKLHERYRRVLRAANSADRTVGSYLGSLRRFDDFLNGQPPLGEAGPQELGEYLTHLAGANKSDSTIRVANYSMRGFFRFVLKRKDWDQTPLPRPRRPKRLPEIPSVDEVVAILDAAPNLKYRAAFMTLYGCGLRTDELLHLEPHHIDSMRMVIRVELGKGRKDRDVLLPKRLLPELRECWRQYQPQRYLFEGTKPGQPMAATSLQRTFTQTSRKVGIKKRLSPRSLRHACATHLVEDGASLRKVQALLGHQSLSTTTVYTHLAKNWLSQIQSPLDRLELDH